MELNKFEKEFKKQLDAREIQPSKMAWEKLDAMLTVKEKPKANFFWIYIAASFVGFLLIGTFYFRAIEPAVQIDIMPLVIEQKQNSNDAEQEEVDNEYLDPDLLHNNNSKANNIVGSVHTTTKAERKLNKDDNLPLNNVSNDKNAVVVISEKPVVPNATKNRYMSAEKLLAEVSTTKNEINTIDKISQRTRGGIAVSSNDLLNSAESELDQSFKESAVNKINKNYNALRTVLINRNYQE
ncbi:hypothetical protein [Flavobacterium weaverense]|uniref:Uncharacterized protein n=1 Tax=Flavobacterium weaverense TaxID=271156 RepID=A0A3M0AFC8_9FLAO|nr:hypothetical protein [Flavobacterium weaverense]RMA77922.1 hypothetical protein BC961_0280 [Flavobacterium weaverense]